VAADFERLFAEFDRQYSLAQPQRRKTTPNLSVLRVFGLETREHPHSDVLAWFLRKNAEHEQGDLFMHTLLQLCDPSIESPLGEYIVEREKDYGITPKTIIDVTAYKRGEFSVFIENKIQGRKDEPKQFERLVKSLIKVSAENKIGENLQFAIYLTDNGRRPDEPIAQELEKKVKPRYMRRVELFDAFDKALRAAPEKSSLLSQLLDNYLREIKRLV
jgi:hypothetical protein